MLVKLSNSWGIKIMNSTPGSLVGFGCAEFAPIGLKIKFHSIINGPNGFIGQNVTLDLSGVGCVQERTRLFEEHFIEHLVQKYKEEMYGFIPWEGAGRVTFMGFSANEIHQTLTPENNNIEGDPEARIPNYNARIGHDFHIEFRPYRFFRRLSRLTVPMDNGGLRSNDWRGWVMKFSVKSMKFKNIVHHERRNMRSKYNHIFIITTYVEKVNDSVNV